MSYGSPHGRYLLVPLVQAGETDCRSCAKRRMDACDFGHLFLDSTGKYQRRDNCLSAERDADRLMALEREVKRFSKRAKIGVVK